jgi:beta-glucosidase
MPRRRGFWSITLLEETSMKPLFHSDRRSYVDRALLKSDAVETAGKQRFLGRFVFGLAVLATGVMLNSPVTEAQPLPWMNTALPPEQRAALLVGAMTLPQKEQQLVGNQPEIVPELPQCRGARHVRGIASLAIPTLRITNGPVGIGQNDCVDPSVMGFAAFTDPSSAKATALPSAIALAASFDPAVATEFGNVIGTEANNLALHVFEAPGVNMARIPVLGRNFEYFGEDPYLTGTMAVAEIKAVQAKGVIAMAKHFAANEQETNRMTIQETVDRRVLREIYLLPFEMAVKDGDTASVMCSYNSVNGFQACENKELLTDVLRNQWGFKGYVQSDFFAVRSTAASMLAGLDHLMPFPQMIVPPFTPVWSPAELNAALAAGQLQVSDLDRALLRRYTQMFRMGIFERQPLVQTPIDFAAGGVKARAIGVQSAVLLQNDNHVLPFDANTVRNVVVIGKATQVYAQQAVAGGVLVGQPMGAGGGSSDVVPNYTVTPVDGLKSVLTALGNTAATVTLITVKDDNSDLNAAKAAAAAADAVIIMAGTIAEEGADRASFADSTGLTLTALGDGLDWYVARPNAISTATSNPPANSNTVAMIAGILGANSTTAKPMTAKTALVLKDNAGVAMDPVLLGPGGPAILEVWFPGQEDGHIVADLLFGVVNPSGKLPVTFPKVGHGFMDWVRTDPSVFPGVRNLVGQPEVEYKEGLNIGYRWYDANAVAPAFPFGHGLSYTTFSMSSLSVTPKISDGTQPISIQFFLENTGTRAGTEVPQLYLGLPPQIGEPPKRLVAFEKIWLNPGERTKVQLTIDPAATNHPLSYWDANTNNWRIPTGFYPIYVGSSSADIALLGTMLVRPSR